MLKITNLKVRSYDIDYLDVFWEIEPTYDDVHAYTFTVERSNAEFGPFTDLTGAFSDKYHVRDNTVKGQHSFYTKFFYRIRVIKLADSSYMTYPEDGSGVALEAPPDLMALEMARSNRFKLKTHSGRALWVFPRKRTGQRCSCYDEVMQRKLRSGCKTCYDTSWVGGYDTPVQIYGQIFDPVETTMKTHIGEVNAEQSVCRLPNFPEVMPGWVIIEAENKRWRVGTDSNALRKVHKGRALIRQEVPIHRIPTGDIEFQLPLNVSNIDKINTSPPKNFTSPKSLTSDKVVDSALSFFIGSGSGHG